MRMLGITLCIFCSLAGVFAVSSLAGSFESYRAVDGKNITEIVAAEWLGCESNDGPCVIKGSNKCKVGCEFESTKEALKSVCVGRPSCAFAATNAWFGDHNSRYQDPAGGHRKMLLLTWMCGSERHFHGYIENDSDTIGCEAAQISIQSF